MKALIDLPTRRNEGWKYSDLRGAVDESVQFALSRDRTAPEVAAGLRDAGIIGALAEQAGSVTELAIAGGEAIFRVDRPRTENRAPTLLRASVAAGGALTRVVVQAESPGVVLDAIHVRLAVGAAFRQFTLAEGGKLSRIEAHVSVEGEGADVQLHGAYVCGTGRHADLTSVITHSAPSSRTQQVIRGVAKKGGRGVFQGKIVVERTAQKTDARQHHKGMLLEDGAEIFAKPELMIYADDVACAHGNTAGGVDHNALFYLRSRGLPQTEARALLTEAFLREAVPDWLVEDIRSEIEDRIAAWLRSGP